MALTNAASIPGQTSYSVRARNCYVEYSVASADTMMDGKSPWGEDHSPWLSLPRDLAYQVERITYRIGPKPAECVIYIPFKSTPTPGPGNDARQGINLISTGWKPFGQQSKGSTPGYGGIAPFGPTLNLPLWTKIRIFPMFPELQETYTGWGYRDLGRIFIGYVTDIEYVGREQHYTGLRITAKDARVFLEKTPISGALYYNPGDKKYVWIRDHRATFNEHRKPNKLRWKESGTGDQSRNVKYPCFIWTDYNRFQDNDDNHFYAYDSAFFNPDTGPIDPTYIGDPYAEKWLPGHAINYIAMLTRFEDMRDPKKKKYTDPAAAIPENECPPLRDCELKIPIMEQTKDGMWNDFFVPRAFTGQTTVTGFKAAQSGLGEFCPVGLNTAEAIFEICRRVGNYTIAVQYEEDDTTTLKVIRTCQSFNDDKAKVGLSGGSKQLPALWLPDDDCIQGFPPNIHSFSIKASQESYANRIHHLSGRRRITVAFSTQADQQWRDGLGQDHMRYLGPKGQWQPQLIFPTLVPAWTKAQQDTWMQYYVKGQPSAGDTQVHPDVFLTWIVPQDGKYKIDWVKFFNARCTRDGIGLFGFRRFFERDRQMLEHLVYQVYDVATDIFRSRRQRIPAHIARGFRGIRVDGNGATAYGSPLTEFDQMKGYEDWYFGNEKIDFKLLNDGRMGFMLGPEARLNGKFRFENQGAGKPYASGASRSPWSWNGLDDTSVTTTEWLNGVLAAIPATAKPNARSYEMLLLTTIEVDEDIWEQIDIPNNGHRKINIHGPLLEKMRTSDVEYGVEQAVHGMAPVFNKHDNEKLIAKPPVTDADNKRDERDELYEDDRKEIVARVRMDANRHGMPDGEYTVETTELMFGFEAGDYIPYITRAGGSGVSDGKKMWVNAMVDVLTLDFMANQTVIHLANVR